MSTVRFSHFLDSLQAWSAEAPPSRTQAPNLESVHGNVNQSARVKRVKGLLEAVVAKEREARDDFDPAEDLLLGPDADTE